MQLSCISLQYIYIKSHEFQIFKSLTKRLMHKKNQPSIDIIIKWLGFIYFRRGNINKSLRLLYIFLKINTGRKKWKFQIIFIKHIFGKKSTIKKCLKIFQKISVIKLWIIQF